MSDNDPQEFLGRRVRRLDQAEGWRKADIIDDEGTVNMTRAYNRRSRGRVGGQVHVVWDAGRCSWIAPDRLELIPDATASMSPSDAPGGEG